MKLSEQKGNVIIRLNELFGNTAIYVHSLRLLWEKAYVYIRNEDLYVQS